MGNEIVEQDPLTYVRERLRATKSNGLLRIAADAGITERTLRNVMNGERDVKYSTVMALQKALLEAAAKS